MSLLLALGAPLGVFGAAWYTRHPFLGLSEGVTGIIGQVGLGEDCTIAV